MFATQIIVSVSCKILESFALDGSNLRRGREDPGPCRGISSRHEITYYMAPDHLCNLGELTLEECSLIANVIVVVVFVHRSAPKISFDVLSPRQRSAGQTSEKGMSREKVFWQTG